METPTYQIGGTTYRLERISTGQLQHIMKLLSGVTFSEFTAEALLLALSDRMADFLACILIPEGKTRTDVVKGMDQGRNYPELQKIRCESDWDIFPMVIADFLHVNPVGSIPALWARINEGLTGWKMQMSGNGKSSSAILREETSRSASTFVAS